MNLEHSQLAKRTVFNLKLNEKEFNLLLLNSTKKKPQHLLSPQIRNKKYENQIKYYINNKSQWHIEFILKNILLLQPLNIHEREEEI